MRMQALSRTEKLFAFDHLTESVIEGNKSALEFKASRKACLRTHLLAQARRILPRSSFIRNTLRPNVLGGRHSPMKCHRAWKDGDLLQPSRFEPGADLGIGMLPLITGRVPVKRVQHAP